MKYFAYGSNMLFERLRERVPSVVALGTANLKEYALSWHKVGRDGSGKCSIIKTSNQQDNVWGVLYKINPSEKLSLDKVEGLGHGYDGIKVQLEFNGEIVKAYTYIATNIAPSLKPFHWYKDFVIAGAIQNKLPQYYISILQAADSTGDLNKKRNSIAKNILEKALKQQI